MGNHKRDQFSGDCSHSQTATQQNELTTHNIMIYYYICTSSTRCTVVALWYTYTGIQYSYDEAFIRVLYYNQESESERPRTQYSISQHGHRIVAHKNSQLKGLQLKMSEDVRNSCNKLVLRILIGWILRSIFVFKRDEVRQMFLIKEFHEIGLHSTPICQWCTKNQVHILSEILQSEFLLLKEFVTKKFAVIVWMWQDREQTYEFGASWIHVERHP